MPRKQTTAAQRARQKKRSQGGRYTELLRTEQQDPKHRLVAALESAGLTAEAQQLLDGLKPKQRDLEWEAAKVEYERAYRAATAQPASPTEGR